jgi:hypothetical protein
MDRAGLLALRVKDESDPDSSAAFPGGFPVAEGNVLAYSCAAARELHPLPCLRRAAKTRVPKDDKEQYDEKRVMAQEWEVKWKKGWPS